MVQSPIQAANAPSSRALLLAGVAALAVTASSCTNNMGPSYALEPLQPESAGVNFDPGSLTSTKEGSFLCPNNPNVTPSQSQATVENPDNPSGIGPYDQFTACPNVGTPYQVAVHGQTEDSSVICVFPAAQADAYHIYAIPDPSSGLPLYQCMDLSTLANPQDGVVLDYEGVSYNALFVLEDDSTGTAGQQMQTCLVTGQPSSCPPYSYGKFR